MRPECPWSSPVPTLRAQPSFPSGAAKNTAPLGFLPPLIPSCWIPWVRSRPCRTLQWICTSSPKKDVEWAPMLRRLLIWRPYQKKGTMKICSSLWSSMKTSPWVAASLVSPPVRSSSSMGTASCGASTSPMWMEMSLWMIRRVSLGTLYQNLFSKIPDKSKAPSMMNWWSSNSTTDRSVKLAATIPFWITSSRNTTPTTRPQSTHSRAKDPCRPKILTSSNLMVIRGTPLKSSLWQLAWKDCP